MKYLVKGNFNMPSFMLYLSKIGFSEIGKGNTFTISNFGNCKSIIIDVNYNHSDASNPHIVKFNFKYLFKDKVKDFIWKGAIVLICAAILYLLEFTILSDNSSNTKSDWIFEITATIGIFIIQSFIWNRKSNENFQRSPVNKIIETLLSFEIAQKDESL